MNDYVSVVRLLRPYLYNSVYNQPNFKERINNFTSEVPQIENTIIEYYPFSVYFYYRKSDDTTSKVINNFESLLKELISENKNLVNKLFDELYQDRSTTDTDREEFYQTIISNLNKVYSYNIIPQNDYISMMNIIL